MLATSTQNTFISHQEAHYHAEYERNERPSASTLFQFPFQFVPKRRSYNHPLLFQSRRSIIKMFKRLSLTGFHNSLSLRVFL